MPLYELGELFCGPGGIAYGAVTASIEKSNYRFVHKWATDYDEDTCATYAYNICRNLPESVYCKDIRKFDMNRLPDIDALAFGFPCNDYSILDEQKSLDDIYDSLYYYGIKAIKIFKPLFFSRKMAV